MRVFIVLPVKFAARDFLHTPVLKHLSDCKTSEITLFSQDIEDKDLIDRLGNAKIRWKRLNPPSQKLLWLRRIKGISIWKWIFYRIFSFWIRSRSGFGMLVYRFNHMHQFAGHVHKSKLPIKRKLREARAGNFVSSIYGFPFPKSQIIFKLLSKAYYSIWDANLNVESLFNDEPPDLVVITYPQHHRVRPYRLAALRRSIPQIAVIGSWDKLTTKGPLGPGFDTYIVGSQVMLRELRDFHDVSPSKVKVIGWPKMDFFCESDLFISRERFLQSIGIPSTHKMILFAGNSPRIGPGEPSIVDHMVRQLSAGIYGDLCSLAIRPHPKDHLWQVRFDRYGRHANVHVFQPEHGRIDFLANLLLHCDVLVATQGSICLDAIAMDTCVVNIGYDAVELKNPAESVKNWYILDHFRTIVAYQATRIVENHEELDAAIACYLADPGKDKIARQKVRSEQLEPFDGHSSLRLVHAILGEEIQ